MSKSGSQVQQRSARGSASQSKIEKLNSEAQAILTQKADVIAELETAIEDAEKQLVKLRAEYEAKATTAEIDEEDDAKAKDDDLIDLEKLKQEHDAEIRDRTERQEEEVASMKLKFTRALKDAEAWAEEHAENVYAERSAQLDVLKQELSKIKDEVSEEQLQQSQTRTRLFNQSKTRAMQSAQRIQFLQTQLSELSTVTREELRDVRAKIDECLASVELREREHRAEIEKYEKEIASREERYNTHLECLTQQFNNERQRLNQQYEAAVEKCDSLQRILSQLERHHESRLQATLQDNERMKSTIYQAKSREDESFTDTRSYISQIQSTQHEVRQVQKDLAVVNQEIADLQSENHQLQEELKRLQTGAMRRSSRTRR